MSKNVTNAIAAFSTYRVTGKDFRMLLASALLCSLFSASVVAIDCRYNGGEHQARGTTLAMNICSAAKYFR